MNENVVMSIEFEKWVKFGWSRGSIKSESPKVSRTECLTCSPGCCLPLTPSGPRLMSAMSVLALAPIPLPSHISQALLRGEQRIKTAELNPGDLTTCLAHLQIDGSPGFPRESSGRCHPHFLEQIIGSVLCMHALLSTLTTAFQKGSPAFQGPHEEWEHSPLAARQVAQHWLIICLACLGSGSLQYTGCLEGTHCHFLDHAHGTLLPGNRCGESGMEALSLSQSH